MFQGKASKDIRNTEPCPGCGREPDECICIPTDLDEALTDFDRFDYGGEDDFDDFDGSDDDLNYPDDYTGEEEREG